MAYDEHYVGGGKSGSVSSIDFVETATTNTLAVVPAEQTIIALPFYTRLWKERIGDDGTIEITATAYGMDSSRKYLDENNVSYEWDATTNQYYAEFVLGDSTYKIWLEEEESLEEKLKVVTAQDVAGVAFWKLGLDSEDVWSVIMKYINN